MGPNNYGDRLKVLIDFVSKHPRMRRREILTRLGFAYASAFTQAKHRGDIVPEKDSTYKLKYWTVNTKKGGRNGARLEAIRG